MSRNERAAHRPSSQLWPAHLALFCVLIALPALVALLAVRLLALLPDHSDRLLRLAGPLTAATPALALPGLYSFIH